MKVNVIVLTALTLAGCREQPKLVISPTWSIAEVVARSRGISAEDIDNGPWHIDGVRLELYSSEEHRRLDLAEVDVRGLTYLGHVESVSFDFSTDTASPTATFALMRVAMSLGINMGYPERPDLPSSPTALTPNIVTRELPGPDGWVIPHDKDHRSYEGYWLTVGHYGEGDDACSFAQLTFSGRMVGF